MNNSLMHIEEILDEPLPEERIAHLRTRQQHSLQVLSSIDALLRSNHWKTVEAELLDKLAIMKRQLVSEKDTTEMFRLQGKISYGEKFDLANLAKQYRLELEGIKKQLHATNQK